MKVPSKWEKRFPVEKDTHEYWEEFCDHHGFVEWHEMADEILKVINWDGCITYPVYSKWYDIYYSPLYQAMQELDT